MTLNIVILALVTLQRLGELWLSNRNTRRLLARGATRVDVGQSASATWDVLADPEGNEFCVLSAREE